MRALPNSWARKRGNCMTRTGVGRSSRDEAWSAHRRVGKQCRHLPWSPVWCVRPNFDRISLVDRNDEDKRHAALDGAAASRPRIATDGEFRPKIEEFHLTAGKPDRAQQGRRGNELARRGFRTV